MVAKWIYKVDLQNDSTFIEPDIFCLLVSAADQYKWVLLYWVEGKEDFYNVTNLATENVSCYKWFLRIVRKVAITAQYKQTKNYVLLLLPEPINEIHNLDST